MEKGLNQQTPQNGDCRLIPNEWGPEAATSSHLVESGDGAKGWGLQTHEETVESQSEWELNTKKAELRTGRNLPVVLRNGEEKNSKGLKPPHLCFPLSPKLLEVSFGPAATIKSVKEQKFNQGHLKI